MNIKERTEKDKIVEARPGVSIFSEIKIKENERRITIGGFTGEGGFYLINPYELVKAKGKNIVGEMETYYNFVKSSKKMSDQEKAIRKAGTDKLRYLRQRKRQLEKELKQLNKNIEEEK